MREHIQQATDLRDAVVTCFLAGDGGELGCDLDRLYDLIDAALRRAKAEVWREAAMELHSKSKAIRTEAVTWGWGETAEQLSRIAFECDARAAQIEEGE